MSRLRAALIVILILATLPWRAHLGAGAFLARAPMASAAGVELSPQDDPPVIAAEGQAAKAYLMPTTCPGPKLPGSVCSSPVAILPGEASLPLPPGRGLHLAADLRLMDIWHPEGPSDPPRSC